jgi:hypothetical protein
MRYTPPIVIQRLSDAIFFQLALKEHDEKQLYLARQHLLDLRNMYAVLTDLIHKNISKVKSLN